MNTQEAYKQKLEANLKKFDAEIDKMAAAAQEMQADAQTNMRQQVETLRRKRDEMNAKVQKLGEANATAFEKMQTGVEAAWRDLTDAVKNARQQFK